MSSCNTTFSRASGSVGTGLALVMAMALLFWSPDLYGQASTPTFTGDVAPILQRSCVSCHNPQGIGPMSLMTYEETRRYAPRIRSRVGNREMPPWHLDAEVGIQDFKNDVSLSNEEVETLVHWVDSGAPRGKPDDMPPPVELPDPDRWQLEELFGPPDLVVRSTPYTVVANGLDQWWGPRREFDGIEEERWIRAAEFKPAYPLGKRVVHHGHANLSQAGRNGERGTNTGLARYGVGKSYDILPEGVGIRVPPGPASISWSLHYFPIGEKVEDDVVEVGVWFYPKDEQDGLIPGGERQFLVDGTSDDRGSRGSRAKDLIIPPHGKLVLEDTHVLQAPAMLYSFRPHMHMRGTGMSMEAIYPDGSRELLSYVDRYNHYWQITYIYDEDTRPLLPKGTVLLFNSFFDNTADNPVNADPTQWVGFGSRSVDEMSHAWLGIAYLPEEEYQRLIAQRLIAQGRSEQENVLARRQDP